MIICLRCFAVTTKTIKKTPAALEDAANIAGVPLNQFIVQAALEKAALSTENFNKIILTVESAEFFFKLIDNPPPPNERLAKAFDRYHKRKVVAEDGTVSFNIT